ncbi:MAG TPA: membrane protein insertion efficiency factor YidD [Thermoanaerobaculia bacterium]|nr:membrane protein insertion efficiency factor YidD [Thermoanaerobaculia bacterium]
MDSSEDRGVIDPRGRGKPDRSSGFPLIVLGFLALFVLNKYGKFAGVYAIDQYRARLAPHVTKVVDCKFEPSCSLYGRESIQKHGLVIGGARTVWRLVKCGPWTKTGTVDPP